MLIYLASPYTHPEASIRDHRAREACRVAVALIERGYHVLSPIAFHHQIALCGGLPAKWEYWEELDRKLLAVCGEMWIVALDGWTTSVGVAAEIEIAKELGMPVYVIDPVSLFKRSL